MRFAMKWLRLVGSIKSQVSFAKEPYKRDCILQKRPETRIPVGLLLRFATSMPMSCIAHMELPMSNEAMRHNRRQSRGIAHEIAYVPLKET